MTNINEIPAVLVFVGEYKQAASKVVIALCIGPGLCRIVYMDFREHLPTFMCVAQVHILDDAQKGAEDGSRTPRHRRWLWKNRPSVFLEAPTAHRDRREIR